MVAKMNKMLGDYLTAWNSHDVERLLTFFTNDCLYEDVSLKRIIRGKTELRALLDSVFVDIADLKMDIKSVFSAGNWGASEWEMSGRFVHSSQPALAATGKSFLVRGATIFELSNGKISRNTDYLDVTAFLQQVETTFDPVARR
jgi:steroid delta-isomerase-like uncharacterized protein